MALFVICRNPRSLIDKVKEDIDRKNIDTWSYDNEGDFTHNRPQWNCSAWMRPHINDDSRYNLSFGFIGNSTVITTTTLYAVYHARFLEMLLAHYDEEVTGFYVSSMPDKNIDAITTKKVE